MSDIQYKCPSCSAPIEFDPASGLMRCDYCGTRTSVESVEAFSRSQAGAGPAQADGGYGPPGAGGPGTTSPGAPGSSAGPGAPAPGPGAPAGYGTVPPSGSVLAPGTAPAPATAPATGEGSAPGTVPAPGSAAPGTAPAPATGWQAPRPLSAAEERDLSHLVCNSCGAEIVGDRTLIATRCGFCGNTFVAASRIRATQTPNFLIPFALDRKAMVAAFRKATKGKFLLPPAFRDEHTLTEATGAYLPYWFHDGQASGTLRFHAENYRHWSDSAYDYTETKVYDVVREGSVAFRGIPVCGTTKLEPARAEGVEPFDVQASRPFATAYLSGYVASSYDIAAKDTLERADTRARESLTEMVEGTVTGYSTLRRESCETRVDHTATWYALLPVWLIVISYAGKSYPFAVNGQTGEVVGTFPVSRRRLNALYAAFMIPLGLLFGTIGWFIVHLSVI